MIRSTVSELRGEGRGWAIIAVAMGWFLVVGMMLTLPALLPRIKAEFALTNTSAGVAVTVLWLVYGGFQFPAGLLTDRLGERRMLLGSMAVGTGVTVLFVLAPSFLVFVVTCGLLGVVGGLFATPRITLLSRLFPDRSGTAIGAVMSFGNVGAAVLPAAAGLIAAAVGWRLGFGVAIPVFIAAFLAVWFSIGRLDPATEVDTADDAGDDLSLRETLPRVVQALKTREILLVTAGVTLTFFTFQGLTAFLTTYLTTMKGISDGIAATLFGGLFALAAIAQPVAGRVADGIGERFVLVGITGLYAVLLVLLVAFDTFWAIVGLVVLLGTQRGATPVATSYLTATLPADIRGSGYGLLRTIFTGVASSAAVVVGVLADADRFDTAFLLLAGLAVLATGCFFLLPDEGP